MMTKIITRRILGRAHTGKAIEGSVGRLPVQLGCCSGITVLEFLSRCERLKIWRHRYEDMLTMFYC